MNNIELKDLYKFTKDNNNNYILSESEYNRFQENFKDYLQIRYTLNYNDFVRNRYNELYVYCQWFNDQ